MSTLTLASWNVNSLKVRLPQVLDWLNTSAVDALVLQETKLTDDAFPIAALNEAGFDAVFIGQKTYNGVALLTRRATMEKPEKVELNIPGYPDEQKRFVAADIRLKGEKDPIRFAGGYFPNGMVPGSKKYLYKLDWLRALTEHLEKTLETSERLVLGGDFNIAPADADVWDPVSWKDRILVSPPERAAFEGLENLGLKDSFRHFHPDEADRFSWWDYRQRGYEKNHGLRIDHLLVSDALIPFMKGADIDTAPRENVQPSDHAPITVTFSF